MLLMRWRNRSFAKIKIKCKTFIIICSINSGNKQLGKHILDNKVKIFGKGFFRGEKNSIWESTLLSPRPS